MSTTERDTASSAIRPFRFEAAQADLDDAGVEALQQANNRESARALRS